MSSSEQTTTATGRAAPATSAPHRTPRPARIRMRPRATAFLVPLGLVVSAAAGGAIPFTLASYRDALAVVQRGISMLGGVDAIERAGGLTVIGEGSYDLAGGQQGLHPDRPEPMPLHEVLVLDPAAGRMVHEGRSWTTPDVQEHRRRIYDDGRPPLVVDLLNRHAYWDMAADAKSDLDGYRNVVPHYLLARALESRASLRRLPAEVGRAAVSMTLASGQTLSLGFDPETGLPQFVEYLVDMPNLGDAPVRWTWDGWHEVPGLGLYPAGHTVTLGGTVLRKLRYERVAAGSTAGEEWLSVPDDIDVADPPPLAGRHGEPPPPEPREVADGVHVLADPRAGNSLLVVEFADFLAVVGAPAARRELQQLPATTRPPGETSSSISQRVLEAARSVAPGKRVKYVVLTHWHGDKAGGARVFLAAGASVVATSTTAGVVGAAARRAFTLEPDPWAGRMMSGSIEVVDGRHVMSDGQRELHLIDVGQNPHATGMLVAWLPKERILFQDDLFDPGREGYFPAVERLPVMRWFVDWLERSGLDPERIYAVRGGATVTPEQIGRIRALD